MTTAPSPGRAEDIDEPMGVGVVAAARSLIQQYWPAAGPNPRAAAAAAVTATGELVEHLVAATRPDRGSTVLASSRDLQWLLGQLAAVCGRGDGLLSHLEQHALNVADRAGAGTTAGAGAVEVAALLDLARADLATAARSLADAATALAVATTRAR